MASERSPEATAALLMLQQEIEHGDDPLQAGGYLAVLGNFMLASIGFEINSAAAVQVDIGTSDHPTEARITLTWELPEAPPTPADKGGGHGE